MVERVKLSKRTVDGLQPDAAGRYIAWDTELKGFGLLVLPTGVKTFILDYRTPEGVKKRLTIGKLSGALPPDKAREIAQEKHLLVKNGHDPAEERREARAALRVSDLLDEYVKGAAFTEKASSTQAIDRGRIERHLKPALGKEYIGKLTADMIRRAYRDIASGKTATTVKTGYRGLARVQGGEGTAKKAILLLGAALAWGEKEGHKLVNPVPGIKLQADKTRNVVLESQDDYRRLFETLDEMEAERRLRAPVIDAIRLIALTGARRGEIAGLRWRHVDLKAGVLRLPATEHKGGRKSGEERVIGLPAVGQAIITRQAPEDSLADPDGLVFRPAHGIAPLSLNKPWTIVRAAAGLPSDLGLHGLRHSLATSMAMAGAGASEIMTALGHRDISTSAKYVHYAKDKRQELAERAASHISAAMQDSKPGAPVKKLKVVK